MGPQSSLNQYLREVADKPFRLGRHDCLTFTNEAWRRMYGYGWADDWIGRYMSARSQDDLRAEFGFDTFEEAIDKKLKRTNHLPPRCALVMGAGETGWLTGRALGLCVGINSAFLSNSGVVYVSTADIASAWINP